MSDIKWVLLADQVDYGQGLNVAALQFGGKEQAVVHLHSTHSKEKLVASLRRFADAIEKMEAPK